MIERITWSVGLTFAMGPNPSMGALSSYSEAVHGLDPIAYYEFEEDDPFASVFVDSSTYSNDILDARGFIGTLAPGYIEGNGIFLDGSASLLTPLTFDPSTSPWSVELVAMTFSPTSSTQVIVSNQDGVGRGRSNMMINNSGASTNPNSYDSFIGGNRGPAGGPVEFGMFQHLVLTFDGGTLNYYVDGVNTGSDAKIPEFATGAWILGSGKGRDIQFWTGYLDEAVFYDKPLTPGEILGNYNALQGIPEPGVSCLSICAGLLLMARRRR